MQVLIADKLADRAVSGLAELGLPVGVQPDLTADDLPGALGDVGILVVRSTKVTTKSLESAPSLGLVIRAGSGVNTIDVATASSRGIHVANCPGKNADAVAELAIGLLIAADRRIVNATCEMRRGAWKKKEFGKARGLKGRQLGLLGLGAIGRAVARRALGLEMAVLAWSRSLTDEIAAGHGIQRAASPEQIASQCDAVSVHLPLTDDTRHFVGDSFLSAMQPGSILVNTSRGELVDTAALKRHIAQKQLRVGLDVYEDEPAGGENSFNDVEFAEQITCTPHVGASTDQTSEAIAEEVVRIVREYLATGRPPGSVNLCQRSPATHQIVVRHLNRIGVLAGVLDALREEHINIEEMENTIFDGAHAASCTMRLDGAPSPDVLNQLRTDEAILQIALS